MNALFTEFLRWLLGRFQQFCSVSGGHSQASPQGKRMTVGEFPTGYARQGSDSAAGSAPMRDE